MATTINTMLDATLFADTSYESTFEMVSERNDEIQYSVSNTFSKLLDNNQLIEEEPVRDFFSSYSSFYDHQEMANKFAAADLVTFSAEEYYETYSDVYRAIAESVYDRRQYTRTYGEGSYLADVLFDEFVFSVRNSPILSRLKNVPRIFKNVVAYSIEISKEALDENWDRIQSTVGAQVTNFEQIKENLRENAEQRLDEDDPILVSTYLRQFVKDYSPSWIIHLSNRYLAQIAGVLIGGMVGGAVSGGAGARGGGIAGGIAGSVASSALEDVVLYLADP